MSNQAYVFINVIDTDNMKLSNKSYSHLRLVTKKDIVRSIQSNQVLSYKKQNGHYCAVLIDDILQICRSGKICMFYAEPKVFYLFIKCIYTLLKSELRPYIITILSKDSCKNSSIDSSDSSQSNIKTNYLSKQIERFEKYLSPYSDCVLKYDDDKLIVEKLLKISRNITDKAHWQNAE